MNLLAGPGTRLRSFWRRLRGRDRVDAEVREEFRQHIELRAADLQRAGLPWDEAVRRARIEFGGVEKHRAEARAALGLSPFDEIAFSWLDVKLGLRMLVKYPGLSTVSVIGLAVAIAIGGGAFGFIDAIMDPTLPLDEDERIVSIQVNTAEPGNPERRILRDFELWRDDVKTLVDLGAFRTVTRNLIGGASPEPVSVAEITASGFRVARVPPLLGRTLLDEDERPGAPHVVVIAYEEWQRRFAGDDGIVGRTIRLGDTEHVVVGVMPEGFRFPINHRYWMPFRLSAASVPWGEGPAIMVFARLAPGVTLEEARTELATLGARVARDHPATHEHMRPTVLRYALPFFDVDSPVMALAMRMFQMAVALILVVVAVNVAVLMHARTATRAGEITVRTALGASRRRVVAQLFAESFVLCSLAAVVGLGLAGASLEWLDRFFDRAYDGGEFPFWIDFGISSRLVIFTFVLAVVGGVIVGVVPALKATGARVQAGLQQLSSRGSGIRLGRKWSALIITQVAFTVAILPFALYFAGQGVKRGFSGPGFAAGEFLRASVRLDDTSADPVPFSVRAGELVRRVRADAAVAGVTYKEAGYDYAYRRIEGEAGGTDWTFMERVDVDFFSVLGVRPLAGRTFTRADAATNTGVVIVDRVFAERIFGTVNVVGRRIRDVTDYDDVTGSGAGGWIEIAGVVPEIDSQDDLEEPHGTMYRAIALVDVTQARMSLFVRVRGLPPGSFGNRLREIAASVDPALLIDDARSALDEDRLTRRLLVTIAAIIATVVLAVVLLSAAGIYAMMSFTVVRRRREIGIRSALGADPRRLLAGIFAQAAKQLGGGVLAGLFLAFLIRGPVDGRGLILLPIVAAFMVVVGLLAAIGPARRGLAIQPTEALRED